MKRLGNDIELDEDIPAELPKKRGRPRKDKGKHRQSSGGDEEVGSKHSNRCGAKTTEGKKKAEGNMASNSRSENQDGEATTAKKVTKGKRKAANVTDEEGQIHATPYDTRYRGKYRDVVPESLKQKTRKRKN